MNKVFLRGVIVTLVILFLIIILFTRRSPFGKSNSSFAIEPDKEITRIEFSSEGKKLFLEKKGETWLINGKAEARKSGILYILRILKELEIKSPVSVELFNNEITAKNIIPVKVKVYANRRLLKGFLVYKTPSNIYGNIMKLKESSKPFIVFVPGYEGDIGSGFIPNELFWQTYTVFNLLPSEIASVKFENFSDTSSSFKISTGKLHYTLSGSSGNLSGWDSSLIRRYVSYFAWVPFESWKFDLNTEDKKSFEASQPLYRITVIATNGKKRILSLWTLMTGETGTEKIDSDNVLGRTDDIDEFFIMRYFDIDPLIKKRSYFFTR